MPNRETVLVLANPGEELAEAFIKELKNKISKHPPHIAEVRAEVLPTDPAAKAELIGSIPAEQRVPVFCDPNCTKGMTLLNADRPDHRSAFPAWAQGSVYAVRIGTASPRNNPYALKEYSGATLSTFSKGLDRSKNKRLPSDTNPKTRPRSRGHDSGM